MVPQVEHCRHKRSRDQITCDDVQHQQRATRSKISPHNYPPQFWDTLSEITLTRKALREFDRRTAQEKFTRVVRAAKQSTRCLRSDTKRLAHSAKHGGPNLSSLRGYADLSHATVSTSIESSHSSKRTRGSDPPSSKATTKMNTTGPYDPHFQQKLVDIGVYTEGYRPPGSDTLPKPANYDEICQVISRSRPSISASVSPEKEFEDFKDMNRMAKSEAEAISGLMPFIAGRKDFTYNTAQNKAFNNMEKFDRDLVAPQPDKYYGARLEQVNKRVQEDLGRYIIPSNLRHLPAVPNFFFEGKSAAGRADVAQRQVVHDNAYGARAMFQLQNYGKDAPVYDGNAYTMGLSYCDGQLKLYTTYPKLSASGETEFHTIQLGAYAMTNASETFRQGAAAYRNSRDFAQEQRDRFIGNANAIAQRQPIVATPSSGTGSRINLSSTTMNRSFDSDTSADEVAPGYADSLANHELSKPERCGGPYKRVAQGLHNSAHLRSNPNARHERSQSVGRKAEDDVDGSDGSEETFVTAKTFVTAEEADDDD